MSALSSTRLRLEPEEVDPYEVLGVLPSAPKELIVEVYWHLAGRLLATGERPEELSRELEELNSAYAAIMHPEPAGQAASAGSSGATNGHGERGSWFGIRRSATGQRPARSSGVSPWERLHLEPSAPFEVVELAYGILQTRLRNDWNEDAATGLRRLDEAYAMVRRGDIQPAARDLNSGAAGEAPGFDDPAAGATDAAAAGIAGASPRPGPTRRLQPGTARVAALLAALAKSVAGRAGRATSGDLELSESWALPGPPENLPARSIEPLAPLDPLPIEAVAVPTPDDDASVPAPAEATPESPPAAGELPSEALVRPPGDGAAADREEERPDRIDAPKGWPLVPAPAPGGEPDRRTTAFLVGEAGSMTGVRAAIGSLPFTLGTASTCDLVFGATEAQDAAIIARIWFQGDRFMFHRLGTRAPVFVNGQTPTWAVLEDGDRLQIGDAVLRFQAPAEEIAAPVGTATP